MLELECLQQPAKAQDNNLGMSNSKRMQHLHGNHQQNTSLQLQPQRVVTVAFGLVGSGAILAAISEVTMNQTKFGWMVYNSIATAGYVLCMKHTSIEHKSKQIRSLSKFEMVFYNHVLGVFFLLPAAFAKGEITLFYESSGLHTWGFLWRNLFAGLIGFVLNFTSWNCIVAAGPTAYAIIGTLNAIPTSVLGYFLFHPEMSIQTWFYIGVSTMGGFIYSYVKTIPCNTSASAAATKNEKEDEDYNSCENDTMSMSDASCSSSATNSSSNNSNTATTTTKVAVVGTFHLPHNSEFAGWFDRSNLHHCTDNHQEEQKMIRNVSFSRVRQSNC